MDKEEKFYTIEKRTRLVSNDDMMCPIIMHSCLHENCGECEYYKAFTMHYRTKEILSLIREIKAEEEDR